MAKKRNCRRTTDEDAIHDKAVKMRKMTDEQLVHYVEDRAAKSYSEGYNNGKAQTPKPITVNMDGIISDIGKIKGIGAAKIPKIKDVLELHLGVGVNG